MRTIALFLVGYSLAFWGSTLLLGGPPIRKSDGSMTGPTGSWSFWYTMFKWGSPPNQVSTQGMENPGNPFTVAAQ